jgi:hypothetical protein
MEKDLDLKGMDVRIKAMRQSAEQLAEMAADFPALYRNTSRILASIKMLELNLSDVLKEGLVP